MDKRESYQKTKEHSDKNAQFHWTEGNKFALESFKSLFLISSGGAVAVLGYSATTKTFTYNLGFSLLAFFLSAIFVTISMIMGYYVNLRQGNSHTHSDNVIAADELWNSANCLQKKIKRPICASLTLLLVGIILAGLHFANPSNRPFRWNFEMKIGN